jgi:hypothetical protein
MPAPALQRHAPFIFEAMTLVGADDASKLAAHMVEDLLDDDDIDADPRQAGRRAAPDVA